MAPTLNSKASEQAHATELLLVRRLTLEQAKQVRMRDVLAYMRPAVEPSPHHVMVRRVAGLPGAEMPVEDDGYNIVGPTIVPPDHVWVRADNTKLHPPTILDSRVHGPVPFENILGRVVYYVGSRTDHGFVRNSVEAMSVDSAVLKAEIDLDEAIAEAEESEYEKG